MSAFAKLHTKSTVKFTAHELPLDATVISWQQVGGKTSNMV